MVDDVAARAASLNADAKSAGLNRAALSAAIRAQGSPFQEAISVGHDHLFADVPLFVTAAQIARMHELFDRHALDHDVRWIGRRLERGLAGELFRFVADRRGVFVQPALFEAFGLTVVEAMASGLPTFATRYGGPLEIIEDGRSGFHIDPTDGAECAERIASFLARSAESPDLWNRISAGAFRRIEDRYTWKRYAERVMTLSRIYGFWKFVSNLERQETSRYLEMFYLLQFRPLAAAIGEV